MGEIADAVRSVAETVDTYGLRTTILAILLLGLACFVAWFAVRSADGAAKSAPRAVASVIVVIAAMVLVRSSRARKEWIQDRLEYLEWYEHDDAPWLELMRQAMAAALILRGVVADQQRAVEKREKAAAVPLEGADGVAADGSGDLTVEGAAVTGTVDVTLDDATLSARGRSQTVRIGPAVEMDVAQPVRPK